MGHLQLTCIDCDETFVWSEREQEFYRVRRLSPPRRCQECRRTKRLRAEAHGLVSDVWHR
jgi:hypothetical protein